MDFKTLKILTDITVRRADVRYMSNLLPFFDCSIWRPSYILEF